jgi:ABC-type transport system involved in cytochrome c biogenesis permease component
MYAKRILKNQIRQQQTALWGGSVVSNSMLSIGALLVVSTLLYLLFNLDKSDSLILILLPILVAGIALLFISQLIRPDRQVGLWRRNKSNHKFKNR